MLRKIVTIKAWKRTVENLVDDRFHVAKFFAQLSMFASIQATSDANANGHIDGRVDHVFQRCCNSGFDTSAVFIGRARARFVPGTFLTGESLNSRVDGRRGTTFPTALGATTKEKVTRDGKKTRDILGLVSIEFAMMGDETVSDSPGISIQ